jgi:hypothetical protein
MRNIAKQILENSTFGAFCSEKAKRITEEGQKNIKILLHLTYGEFGTPDENEIKLFTEENTDPITK